MVTVHSTGSEMDQLLEVLPPRVTSVLRQRSDLADLLEVVLDLGRQPEARLPTGDVLLYEQEVTREDLDYVVNRVSDFGEDNRAGIARTLHRISAIRNRKHQVVGITCRVGRAIYGTISIIDDLVSSGKNILLLGRPGVGKTTMLREVARVLADEAKKRVIIVDTSNEIAGDGDVPHSAIGHARRMQVATPALQHAVMIEAVENHMPQVIIIDEMGTEQEAAAARTIAERGVQLIATAHGNTLDNLIMNPTLSDLVGGIQSVTLGDVEARFRGTQKTVLERKAPPTFDVVVEIQNWGKVALHDNVAKVVDQWLRGYHIAPEVRWTDPDGQMRRTRETPRHSQGGPGPWAPEAPIYKERRGHYQAQGDYEPAAIAHLREGYSREPSINGERGNEEHAADKKQTIGAKVFLFGVGRDKMEAAQAQTRLSLEIANELRRADVVLTTKNHYRRGAQLVRVAESSGTPVYVLRKNTTAQIEDFLKAIAREKGLDVKSPQRTFEESPQSPVSIDEAIKDAEEAAQRVMSGEARVQLSPQRAYVRRLQHLLAERLSVGSVSRGREPERSVTFYKR